MAGSAAPGNGPAAGAPRLLGPGAVRGPAGEGKVAAGAMEGVLYKWTNYLSGEWEACQGSGPLSEPREGGVGTRLQGVGVTVPPETREACADRECFPTAVLCLPCYTDTAPCRGWVRAVAFLTSRKAKKS